MNEKLENAARAIIRSTIEAIEWTIRPSGSLTAEISCKPLSQANRSRTEMLVVLLANGVPDAIRTCDLYQYSTMPLKSLR